MYTRMKNNFRPVLEFRGGGFRPRLACPDSRPLLSAMFKSRTRRTRPVRREHRTDHQSDAPVRIGSLFRLGKSFTKQTKCNEKQFFALEAFVLRRKKLVVFEAESQR